MKYLLSLVIFNTGLSIFAQNSQDEADAKKVVTEFFEAFHKQDLLP